jgi:hypothetical protein
MDQTRKSLPGLRVLKDSEYHYFQASGGVHINSRPWPSITNFIKSSRRDVEFCGSLPLMSDFSVTWPWFNQTYWIYRQVKVTNIAERQLRLTGYPGADYSLQNSKNLLPQQIRRKKNKGFSNDTHGSRILDNNHVDETWSCR